VIDHLFLIKNQRTVAEIVFYLTTPSHVEREFLDSFLPYLRNWANSRGLRRLLVIKNCIIILLRNTTFLLMCRLKFKASLFTPHLIGNNVFGRITYQEKIRAILKVNLLIVK